MGRKKAIEEKDLLDLIHNFYVNDCHGNPSMLKLPDITRYINQHGYPDFRVEVLRRSRTARKYIDDLKDESKESVLAKLVAYKTLDVEAFLQENATQVSLRRALTNLDGYYKTIAEQATDVLKNNREREEKLSEATTALEQADLTIETLEKENKDYKTQLKALKAQNAALKDYIDTYIYPDIANKLLEADGVLSNVDTTITLQSLENNVIDAGSDISPRDPKHNSHPLKSGNDKLISIFEHWKE